jgi:two-component system KDP operon response regulator KdpE
VSVDVATHEVVRSGSRASDANRISSSGFLDPRAWQVLTHRQLLLDVWGPGHIERPHYIRINLANLRQKLEDDPTQPQHLISELQVGYRLAGVDAPNEAPARLKEH